MSDLSLKVQSALAQLDHSNDDHWTDDGLPKTSVVQTVAKDTTIKRADITAARPGFDRATAKAAVPPEPLADFEDPAAAPGAPTPAASAPKALQDDAETVEISDAQLLKLLDNRVAAAEEKITRARQMESDAQKMQNAGHDELRAARRDKNKYFPPITEAQNVRSYLDSSNAERAARVAAGNSASHLDAVRRGGAGGHTVNLGYGNGSTRGAFTRKQAAQLGFLVPGSPAAAGMAGSGLRPPGGVRA